uniref:Uncharacterized protein n=1 Tax=Cucumis melo TaxID=3656 RepID=A0A9I9EIT1_CUCME
IPHLCRVHHPSVRVHRRVPPLKKCVPNPSHFIRSSDSLPATALSDSLSASVFDSFPVAMSPSLSPSSQSTFCYILVLLLRAFISPCFNRLIITEEMDLIAETYIAAHYCGTSQPILFSSRKWGDMKRA